MRPAAVVVPVLLTAALTVVPSPTTAAGATCDGLAATIVVTTAPDTTYGTAGDDVIVGTAGDDLIFGLGGNDTICGLGGADHLRGEDGNDRLFGGPDAEYDVFEEHYGDLLVPGPGDDVVDVGAESDAHTIRWVNGDVLGDRVSWEGSPAPVVVDLAAGTATGEGSDTIAVHQVPVGVTGSSFADTISGTDRDDAVDGGPGDDTITTGAGDDSVVADLTGQQRQRLVSDDDTIDTGAGEDDVVIGHSRDTVATGSGDDRVTVERGARGSSVSTGSQDDWISMYSPADVSSGGGRDRFYVLLLPRGGDYGLRGGPDRDLIEAVPVRLRGAAVTWDQRRRRLHVAGRHRGRVSGHEVLHLAEGARWTFLGGGAGEVVTPDASAAPVVLRGRGGNDTLTGTGGDDLLDGGRGRDRLRGLRGRDRCLSGTVSRGCELTR